MLNPSSFLKIVRASAWYDLLVTWPFATPWTFAWLYGTLATLTTTLGLPGQLGTLDTTHFLLASLLGSVVVVWSLARLLQPSIRLGRLDAVARVLFAVWQIVAVASGASAIILLFTLFEVAFGVLQWLPVSPAAKASRLQHG